MLEAYAGANQGGSYAFRLAETSQTDLVLGTTHAGTPVGSGQAQLFRVTVPDVKQLQIVLDDASGADRNEVYVRFGAPPTRADYQYRFTTPASAPPGGTGLLPYATVNGTEFATYTSSAGIQSYFIALDFSVELMGKA